MEFGASTSGGMHGPHWNRTGFDGDSPYLIPTTCWWSVCGAWNSFSNSAGGGGRADLGENASMMKHTWPTPARVGTYVRSVTHNRFGAVAVNSRFSRSGWREVTGSRRVVVTRF